MKYAWLLIILVTPIAAAVTPDMLTVTGTAHANGSIDVDEIVYGEATSTREPGFSEPFIFQTYTAEDELIREANMYRSFMDRDGNPLNSSSYQMRIAAENVAYFLVFYNGNIIARYDIKTLACQGRCTGCERFTFECENILVEDTPPQLSPEQEPSDDRWSFTNDIPLLPLGLFSVLLILMIIGMLRKKR